MNRFLHNNILLKRLLLAIFLLQISAFLGVVTLYYTAEFSQIMQTKETKAHIIFNTIAHQFQHTILNSQKDLQGWAEKLPNGQYNKQSCNIPYTNYLDFRDVYFNYAIADKDGYIVCSKVAYPKDYNLNIAVADYKEFVESKEFRVTGFGLNAQGIPRIAAGYPLLDKDNNFTGAIIVSMNLNEINDLINSIELPEGSQFVITDQTGAIEVINPADEDQIGKRTLTAQVFSLIFSQQEGTLNFKSEDSTNIMYIFKPLQFDSDPDLESFMIYSSDILPFAFTISETGCSIAISLFLITLLAEGVIIFKVFRFKEQQKEQL